MCWKINLLYDISFDVPPYQGDMFDQAKESMKEKDDSELRSFKNAVTCGDAAWVTRGYHSQNATYTLRNYQTGAL